MFYTDFSKPMTHFGIFTTLLLALLTAWGCDHSVEMPTAESVNAAAPVEMESDASVAAAPILPIPAVSGLRPDPRPQLDLRCNGPDLAAHEINFRITQRFSRFRGRVRITGIVKNIGKQAFHSDPRQAGVSLLEDGRVVVERSIAALAPNATLELVYTRNWDSSSPAEGEFPPNYIG